MWNHAVPETNICDAATLSIPMSNKLHFPGNQRRFSDALSVESTNWTFVAERQEDIGLSQNPPLLCHGIRDSSWDLFLPGNIQLENVSVIFIMAIIIIRATKIELLTFIYLLITKDEI